MSNLYFDINTFPDSKIEKYVNEKLKELYKTDEPEKFALVLHNDPINTIYFVAKVIRCVFSYNRRKAVWLMLKAHFSGRVVLWIGSKTEAEVKRNKIVSFGPDPEVVEKGAEPLQITIEKY